MEAVKRYLEGSEGLGSIAKEIGANKRSLQYWVKRYEYHGERAFIKSYPNYSVDFKLDVLTYMNEHGMSFFETAAFICLLILLFWNGKTE